MQNKIGLAKSPISIDKDDFIKNIKSPMKIMRVNPIININLSLNVQVLMMNFIFITLLSNKNNNIIVCIVNEIYFLK